MQYVSEKSRKSKRALRYFNFENGVVKFVTQYAKFENGVVKFVVNSVVVGFYDQLINFLQRSMVLYLYASNSF